MRTAFGNTFVSMLVVALLASCAHSGRLEQLDEKSGATIVRGPDVLVYARTEPRYSRSGRDYLYLGPVETNRQGVREYFLWVGVASTIDRGFIAPPAQEPKTLYVEIGGEPMELPLKPWRELMATGLSNAMYPTTVPVREELAARVTLQQIALIGGGAPEAVRISLGDGSGSRSYTRWHGAPNFDDFIATVGNRVR